MPPIYSSRLTQPANEGLRRRAPTLCLLLLSILEDDREVYEIAGRFHDVQEALSGSEAVVRIPCAGAVDVVDRPVQLVGYVQRPDPFASRHGVWAAEDLSLIHI